jgi:hypothetical protein
MSSYGYWLLVNLSSTAGLAGKRKDATRKSCNAECQLPRKINTINNSPTRAQPTTTNQPMEIAGTNNGAMGSTHARRVIHMTLVEGATVKERKKKKGVVLLPTN